MLYKTLIVMGCGLSSVRLAHRHTDCLLQFCIGGCIGIPASLDPPGFVRAQHVGFVREDCWV